MSDTRHIGYLATLSSGSGHPVLILHAWWGLNATIKGICDRLATAGWLGVFGVIVTLLGFASSFLGLFGITDISLFLELPTMFFEIAIGIWLIVKGFNQEVLESLR